MKIFISMPMKGKTPLQIKNMRKEVEEIILKECPDAEFIDTFIDEDLEEKHPGFKYLAKSIELLDQADIFVYKTEWLHSRGCFVEYVAAMYYDIDMVELNTLRQARMARDAFEKFGKILEKKGITVE